MDTKGLFKHFEDFFFLQGFIKKIIIYYLTSTNNGIFLADSLNTNFTSKLK